MSVLAPKMAAHSPAGGGGVGGAVPGGVAWIPFAAALVIGLGSVLSGPWGLIAAAVALTVPGWSVLNLTLGNTRLDRIAVGILAIVVSLVVLIGICLLLDAVGISIARRSVALSVAMFELAVGTASLVGVRNRVPERDPVAGPGRQSVSGLVGGGPVPDGSPSTMHADEGTSSTALTSFLPATHGAANESAHESRNRLWTWCAVVLGAVSIGAGVAVVHLTAPGPHYAPAAAMSFTGNVASTADNRSLAPGPTTLEVTVNGTAPVVGVLGAQVDGKLAGPLVAIQVASSQTIRVAAVIPVLSQCRHQLSVVFAPTQGTQVLSITQYVRGEAPGTCTDYGSGAHG